LDSSRTTGIAKPTRRGLNSFLIVRGGLTGPSDDAVRAHEHGQDATRIESLVLDVNKKLHVFGQQLAAVHESGIGTLNRRRCFANVHFAPEAVTPAKSVLSLNGYPTFF
jgi:hypothetical protein